MKRMSATSKEYRRIHDWIRPRKKHIKACEKCGCMNSMLDNALIKGKVHEKNANNYIKLCRKCHYNYDHPDGLKHDLKTKKIIGHHSKQRILKNGVNNKFIKSKIGTKLSDEHIKILSDNMKGSNHHQSKLTEDDVIHIRSSSDKPSCLARKYGVTYRTIYGIIKRQTWKHID